MKNASTWKKSVLFGVVLMFASCCALGAIAQKASPAAKVNTIPTATNASTSTATRAIQSTIAPTQTQIAATHTVAPIIKQKATRIVQPTQAASKQAAPTGDSYPCQPGQIKANIESKKYHVPSGASYGKTVKHVVCYDTAQQAEAAGYTRAKR